MSASSNTGGNGSSSTTTTGSSTSKRVVKTINGQELSINIPDNFHQQQLHYTQHLQQHQQQQLQQPGSGMSSMMISPALPSPNFNNFMLTLSPLMQLSSPQPTMSPRDDLIPCSAALPSTMTPMVNTADEIPFAFQPGNDTTHASTSNLHNHHPSAPTLAPPAAHTLMPPPPPRFRQPREEVEEELDPHHDPHNHPPPRQPEQMDNGSNTLADKFHLLQMGVDARSLEGKPHLMDPAATLNEVMGESFRPSLSMTGADHHHHREFGHVDGGDDDAEEDDDEISGYVGSRKGLGDAEEGVDGEDRGGGYFSSGSSDGTRSTTMEHPFKPDYEASRFQVHNRRYSVSPLTPLASHSAAAAAAAGVGLAVASAGVASSSSSSSSSSTSTSRSRNTGSHKKTGGGSRPASRAGATIRRTSADLKRASPSMMLGGNAVGALHRPIPTQQQNPKKCNCRKSKCLKLYCECFAVGAYCQEDCGCVDCNNNTTHEVTRSKAIDSILSRNPHAFTEKIQFIEPISAGAGLARRVSVSGSVHGDETTVIGGMQGSATGAPTAAHVRGCNCKKSLCIKKYCECFFAGVFCAENCQCEGCQNTAEGAAARLLTKKKKGGNVSKVQQQVQLPEAQAKEAATTPCAPMVAAASESMTV